MNSLPSLPRDGDQHVDLKPQKSKIKLEDRFRRRRADGSEHGAAAK